MEDMAKETEYYIDSEKFKTLVMEMMYSQPRSSVSLPRMPQGFDNDIAREMDSMMSQALASVMTAIDYRVDNLLANLAIIIEQSKKPYTQCMLCCSNGQKTIDDLE